MLSFLEGRREILNVTFEMLICYHSLVGACLTVIFHHPGAVAHLENQWFLHVSTICVFWSSYFHPKETLLKFRMKHVVIYLSPNLIQFGNLDLVVLRVRINWNAVVRCSLALPPARKKSKEQSTSSVAWNQT
jgi:hypothetical protein